MRDKRSITLKVTSMDQETVDVTPFSEPPGSRRLNSELMVTLSEGRWHLTLPWRYPSPPAMGQELTVTVEWEDE